MNFSPQIFTMKKNTKDNSFTEWFEKISAKITKACGSPATVIIAISVVVIWGLTGPVFHYSENWQLIINTSTTIITFIMVFIIQHSQNKDTTAIQMKLNELLASNEKASNRIVNSEDLTEEELLVLKKYYKKLSLSSETNKEALTSHSADEVIETKGLKK